MWSEHLGKAADLIIFFGYGADLLKGRSAARKAGIEGKSAHGLRVACATRLAERGASTHQIAAWTGHKSLSEVAHYSREADAKRLLDGGTIQINSNARPEKVGVHVAQSVYRGLGK